MFRISRSGSAVAMVCALAVGRIAGAAVGADASPPTDAASTVSIAPSAGNPADAPPAANPQAGASQAAALPSATDFTLAGAPAMMDTAPPAPSAADNTYHGGRGLVTLFGMTGMFQNPTSGTLNQGQLTIQQCDVWINTDPQNRLSAYGLMAAYGVTDWLEVGGFGVLTISPGHEEFFTNSSTSGGPFVRVRLLKDKDWVPEVSIGGTYFDGTFFGSGAGAFRCDQFIAASKLFKIDPDGILRSIRLHGGYRYQLTHAADFSYLYTGVEVELPYSIYAIGELQSHSLTNTGGGPAHDPYSVGLQWKPNSVLGLSIAGIDIGNGRLSPWFGIGLNFQL